MEFNGLLGSDFDFFKKKDKMIKEEYEKGRNEVKSHFRALCYEIQKIYHKKTNGVLELDKDFQSFNKRSNNIFVKHEVVNSKFHINVLMDSEVISVGAVFLSNSQDDSKYILDILRDKRNTFWGYIMANKYMNIIVEVTTKDKKADIFKLGSLEINVKNYESLISFIESNVQKGRTVFKIFIGYIYSKNECIKQGKNFANTVYDGVISTREMIEKMG